MSSARRYTFPISCIRRLYKLPKSCSTCCLSSSIAGISAPYLDYPFQDHESSPLHFPPTQAHVERLKVQRLLLVAARSVSLAQRTLLYAHDELAMATMRMRLAREGERG